VEAAEIRDIDLVAFCLAESIGSGVSLQHVGAQKAREKIVLVIADQRVVMLAATELLDADRRIACSCPSIGRASCEID
jgi:F420-dependent methylenetetrahydromethanopterin dehydrogenase